MTAVLSESGVHISQHPVVLPSLVACIETLQVCTVQQGSSQFFFLGCGLHPSPFKGLPLRLLSRVIHFFPRTGKAVLQELKNVCFSDSFSSCKKYLRLWTQLFFSVVFFFFDRRRSHTPLLSSHLVFCPRLHPFHTSSICGAIIPLLLLTHIPTFLAIFPLEDISSQHQAPHPFFLL